MTRDEILAEIERLSTEPTGGVPSLATIAVNMDLIVKYAGTCAKVAYDQQYLTEALVSAMERLSTMIEIHSL